MNIVHSVPRMRLAVLGALTAVLFGNASAVTLENLRESQLDDIYGRYAPGGDCKREPRITVDASGLAFAHAGKATHTKNIEYALSYGGPEYAGISRWIFPFPVDESDFGRVLLVFNADEKRGTLTAESDLGPGQSLSALQAALVKASPYALCRKSM